MKIFIHDTVFPIGHKLLNNRLLSYLNEDSLLISNYHDYYNPPLENWRFIDYNAPKQYNSSLVNRGLNILASISVLQAAKRESFEKIIYFTFDTVNFAAERLFLNKDVYLIHHLNTSELANPKKAKIFKTYSNKVKHIVFGDFIKNYLVNSIGVDEERVLSLPHPILLNNTDTDEDNQIKYSFGGRKIWIALGYANDLALIDQILKYENQTKLLLKNNIKLILRWFNPPIETESISILSGHLDSTLYNNLYSLTSGVLLLYPHTYQNRFSGAMMDALAKAKPVIGSSIPVIQEFERAYPTFCSSFKSVPDLFSKLIEGSNTTNNCSQSELTDFINRHSDTVISKALKRFIKG